MGIYLALTGKPIGAADCLILGIATHVVNSSALHKIELELQEAKPDGDIHQTINNLLKSYSIIPDKSIISDYKSEIDKYFSENPELMSILDI